MKLDAEHGGVELDGNSQKLAWQSVCMENLVADSLLRILPFDAQRPPSGRNSHMSVL